MFKKIFLLFVAAFGVGAPLLAGAQNTLDDGWQNPPNEARLRAYWWWLNGNVTKASINFNAISRLKEISDMAADEDKEEGV